MWNILFHIYILFIWGVDFIMRGGMVRSMNTLDYLLTRRSVKAGDLSEPGPSKAELEQILMVGMRVPDHKKLAPWRIHVCDKVGQEVLGSVVAEAFAMENPGASERQLLANQKLLTRAPLLLVVISKPVEGLVPVWEQHLSAGAVCMNLLHASYTLGYAGQWLTEWYAYHPHVRACLKCGEQDQIAGFLYIGTAEETPADRDRPTLDTVVRFS